MATKRPYCDSPGLGGTPSKTVRFESPMVQASPKSSAPLDGRMRVYVRVRPENDRELAGNNRRVVEPIDDQLVVFDPVIEEEEYFYQGKTYKEPCRRQNKNIQFHFDRVFDEDSSNMDVYEAVTKKFIHSFLEGYNCAVFAYGATGSGKTHTMLGTNDDPGVIFFTTMELFRLIEAKKEDEQLELSISYFEIYNEYVYDLLTPAIGKQLAVREDPKRGVVVANLSVHQPKDAQHLLDMLEYGNRQRTQHPTDANAESSRSHAVFQVFLKKQDYTNSQEMSIQLSKMSLIDLAGSERAAVAYKTNRNKSLQREGSNINKSLLALGNCINALARRDPNKKNVHIPYRDSKLTLLLRDSLGGSCHTAMIAAVSPSSLSYDDTHNTLTYANRAKGIQLNLKKNNVSVGLQPRNYNQALDSMSRKVNDLTEENNFLKSELNRLKSQVSKVPKNPIIVNDNSWSAFNDVQNELEMHFKERVTLRKQYLEAESNLKKIDLKVILRKIEFERLESLGVDVGERDSFGSLHCKKLHFLDVKSQAEVKLKENDFVLSQLEKQLKENTGDKDWFINAYFQMKNSEIESKDLAIAEKHAFEVSKLLISRLETNEEIILEQESLLKNTHDMLSFLNRISDDLALRFTSLRRKVEAKKSVIWRDDQADPVFKSISRHELENVYHLNVFRLTSQSPKKSRKSRQLTSICITPSPSPSETSPSALNETFNLGVVPNNDLIQ